MKITPNSIAALSYSLTNYATDEELEKTPADKVMKFKFGVGELLPDFEKNIVGLKAGDKFDFKVLAVEAFGPVDPYAIFDIPKDTFENDGAIDDNMLQVGNQIPLTDKDDNKHLGLITLVMEDAVTMDFNHPLAGVDLRFVGEVLEVVE
ncbi:MAG: FKBP-type peptidyl-prolyl cis-trans isomerase [Bacteroidota bacterium]